MRPCFAHSYAQLNDIKQIGTPSSSSNVVTIPSKYLWTIEVHQLYLELFFYSFSTPSRDFYIPPLLS